MSLLRSYSFAPGATSGHTISGIDSTGATAIVVLVAGDSGYTISSVTDSQGGGDNNAAWQQATASSATSAGQARALVCCGASFDNKGASHSITLNYSGAIIPNIHVLVFDGREYTFTPANSKSNVEAGATAATNGNAGDANLSPGSNNALVVGGINTSAFYSTSAYACSNGTLTAPSSTTTGAPGLMSAYVEQTTATPVNLAFSWTTAARFSGVELWLDAAGGGTTQALAGAAAAVATATGNLSVTGAVGTLTTQPLKNNAGTVLASEAGATVHIYSLSGGLVVTKTAQTTSAAGVMTITDAALVPTTQYRVVIVLASGAEGLAKLTAT